MGQQSIWLFRYGHDDEAMGIGGVRPASHQGQPLVVGGGDPAGIFIAHLLRLSLFFDNIFSSKRKRLIAPNIVPVFINKDGTICISILSNAK